MLAKRLLKDFRVCRTTYLLLVCTTGLHGALSVTDLLQDTAAILQALSKQVFLLCDLSQQHAELVADVAQCVVVGTFAPLAQLSSNRSTLFRSILISVDSVVLGLDELVETLGKLGLLVAAQRGKGEMLLGRGGAGVIATLRADRVRAADVPASAMSESILWSA